MYFLYKPLKLFFSLSIISTLTGIALCIRYLFFFLAYHQSGHIQSLILAAICIIVGVQIFLIGILADHLSVTRQLQEEILYQLKLKNHQQKSDSTQL